MRSRGPGVIDPRVLRMHPLRDVPVFSVCASSDHSGSNVSWTTLQVNTRIFDSHNAFDLATGSFRNKKKRGKFACLLLPSLKN